MEESIGIIIRAADPTIGSRIEAFVKQLEGAKIIYFTHNSEHKLYIIDAERMQRLAEGDNGC